MASRPRTRRVVSLGGEGALVRLTDPPHGYRWCGPCLGEGINPRAPMGSSYPCASCDGSGLVKNQSRDGKDRS